MEKFPLYFFMAAVEAQKNLGPNTLDWKELRSSNQGVGTASVNSTTQRQYTAKPVMSSKYKDIQLMNSDLTPLFTYDYYVHLLLQKAWKVPIVYGSLPRFPEADATCYDKGMYALMMMLLFKPYRTFDELLRDCGLDVVFRGTRDQAFMKVYDEFQKWRKKVDLVARSFCTDNVAGDQPVPLTDDWWDCMVSEKMRNYNGVQRRHVTEAGSAPADLSLLPIFTAAAPTSVDDTGKNSASDDSDAVSSSSGEVSSDPEIKTLRDSIPIPPRAEGRADALAKHCGSLPEGSRLEDFHEPPRKIHAKNVEGNYWKEFAEQMRESFPSSRTDPALTNSTSQWRIPEVDALTSAGKQQLFFKGLDKYNIDISIAAGTQQKKKKEFERKLETAVKKLPAVVIPSDTVVMEAAFFLLQQGLLNIPDVGTINVKQARAFLWNAAWLQEYMSAEWRAKGLLQGCPEKPRQFERFCLAIIGPGGTGKTAVLKITEALTIFFAGKETV